ncbi:MAG: trimethylamine methyltransferase family protein [Clostridiales bacterium]
MKARATILTMEEIHEIHESTLVVMENTGLIIDSDTVCADLKQLGAVVDKNHLVKFPKKIVEAAIAKINHQVLYAARNKDHDFTVPYRDITFSSTAGYCPFFYPEPGKPRRRSTAEDLAQVAKLCDALESVDYFWPIIMPTDESRPELEEIMAFYVAIQNTSKHIEASCSSPGAAKWIVKMAELVAGGKEALKARPIVSALSSPTTPLSLENNMVEALPILAKAGIPVVSMDVPLAGTTSPCTFGGSMIVTNAEQLATLVILKMYADDAPMVYASDGGSANMRTGEISYANPDFDLYSMACAQMCRFYNIPGCVSNGGSEIRDFSSETGFNQNIIKSAISLMTLTDLSAWFGSMDDCMATSFWALTLDDEVLKYAKIYNKEMALDKESLAIDAINTVGPRGEFMSSDHTFNNFKRDINHVEIKDSFILNTPDGDYVTAAYNKATEILKNHKILPLKEEITIELTNLLTEARKEFKN